jgi:chemosensory pili system protein ChpA (sensor histidine kinase/response regulator)
METQSIRVIEDEALSVRVLSALLRSQGYEVVTARNIGAGLLEIRKRMPRVILLDLNVLSDDPFAGLTDGFSLLRLLRRNHPADCPPVIIHTVDDSPRTQAQAKELGVAAFLHKGCPRQKSSPPSPPPWKPSRPPKQGNQGTHSGPSC